MRKRNMAVAFATGLMVLGAISAPAFAVSPTTTKIVDDDGLAGVTDQGLPDCTDGFTPAQDSRVFATIQAAVDAAHGGDQIFVCPGTYNESVQVSKRVAILGPQRNVSAFNCPARSNQATITGTGDWALSIWNSNVWVAGLRFANTGPGGVKVGTGLSGTKIRNNVFANNGSGLELNNTSAALALVEQNCFRDNNNGAPGNGIWNSSALQSTFIRFNTFMDHRGAAIKIDGSSSLVKDLWLASNTSRDDVSFAQLKTVNNATVQRNQVGTTGEISKPGAAIKVFGASNTVHVHQNRILSNHTDGILVADTSVKVDIKSNRIGSTDNGISITSTTAAAAWVSLNNVSDVTGTAYNASATTTGNTFNKNRATGISNIDCKDDSTGTGTAGTANTWTGNTMPEFGVSIPEGICTPAS